MSPRWLWHRYGDAVAPRLDASRRWIRLGAYLSIACAGAAAVVWPPQSVRATAGHNASTVAWAVLMAVSSALCAVGAGSNRWWGEYVGLIPLGTTAIVFALSAISRGPTSYAGALFLIGFLMFLAARWQEVALLHYEALRGAQRNRGDRDGPR